MPQTLLAFLAMIVVGSHALNTQRFEMMVQQRDITRELEEMGGSIALETMEIIRSRAWDQAVIDGLVAGEAADLDLMELGQSSQFETGHECGVFGGANNCDDIDDFHDMQTAVRPFIMGTDTLFFSVDVSVQYVTAGLAHSAIVTANKEVTVDVLDYRTDGETFFNTPITLSRVFSYQF